MKRAQTETSYTVKVIVVLAVAIPLLIMAEGIRDLYAEQSPRDRCRISVLAAAQSQKIGQGKPLFQQDCDRENVEINLKNGGTRGKIDQNKVFDIIAQKYFQCWDMMGRNMLDPYGEWDNEDERVCLVCSRIKFTDDFVSEHDKEYGQEGEQALMKGLEVYLPNKEITMDGKTIFELMEGRKLTTEEVIKIEESSKNLALLPHIDYYIIHIMSKKDTKETLKALTSTAGGSALLIGGLVVGGILTGGAAVAAYVVAGVGSVGLGIGARTVLRDCDHCHGSSVVKLISESELNDHNVCTKLVN